MNLFVYLRISCEGHLLLTCTMWCTLPGHVPLVLFGLPSCGALGGSLHLVDAGFSLWSLLNTPCASLYQSVLVTGCVWFDNCAVWLGGGGGVSSRQ